MAICVALLAILVAACDEERREAPAPAPAHQPVTDATGRQGHVRPARRLLRRGPDAAKSLRATAECAGTPPVGVAHLSWRPSRAGPQRVGVTVLRFTTGDFQSSRLLRRARNRLDWRRVSGEAIHHWRVLTRVQKRWIASRIAGFTGPGCVGADSSEHP